MLVPHSCLTLCGLMNCVVHQVLLSMGFPRQEYWSGFPFSSPRYLPDPGIELLSPALAGRFFATEPLLLLLLLLLLSRLSRVQHCVTPKTAAHQAPPSLGFSRQEHWSGLTLPSPMGESEVTQSCPTLHDPVDCSLPGSSVHGIFQVRVLEWGAIAFSDWAIREAHMSLPKLNVVMSVCVSVLSPITHPFSSPTFGTPGPFFSQRYKANMLSRVLCASPILWKCWDYFSFWTFLILTCLLKF